jgi:sulfur carrier protein ThiS
MGKVRIEISPSFAGVLNLHGSDWINIEKESRQWATIGDLLSDLAFGNNDFRKVVFDPITGKLSDEVMVALNGNLLQLSDVTEVKLKDGDNVVLLPMITQG